MLFAAQVSSSNSTRLPTITAPMPLAFDFPNPADVIAASPAARRCRAPKSPASTQARAEAHSRKDLNFLVV